MIPETVILVAAAIYLGEVVDFSHSLPTRMHKETLERGSMLLYSLAGLFVLGAVITDLCLVFSKLQNADSGELDLAGLSSVSWLAVGIVSGICAIAAVALVLVAKSKNARIANDN